MPTSRKSTLKKNPSKQPKIKTYKPLSLGQVYKSCPSAGFRFSDSRKFKKNHDIISQDRAVRSIEMGLGIRKPGYNIYMAGSQGTGKTSVIRSFLEKWSKTSNPPMDWIYVYNFQSPDNPRAIQLPTGTAKRFRKKMEALIKALKEDIPDAMQSEDYENAVNAYVSAANDRKAKMFSELEKTAKTMNFQVKTTRMGIETIPIVDGRSITEKEYNKLDDKQRDAMEDKRAQLEPQVLDFARRVRSIDSETRTYVETLRTKLGQQIVSAHIEPLMDEYQQEEEIVSYLSEVQEHMIENLMDFVDEDDGGGEDAPPFAFVEEKDKFQEYKVNVFIDNSRLKGAPIIIESNPTYYNLFGKIEKNVEHGMYHTDFTMIHSGAIHRANGGYLVLNAVDIFRTPSTWETLKRVLKNRMGYIEDMGEQYSLLPTSGLRPEPVPLEVKVIMIGSDDIYHILHDMDEDFQKIFKIKADFDMKMPRTKTNEHSYASFIATRTQVEKLLPFDKSGMAAVVEYGSRLVDDQRYLSTQFGQIKDLTIEADFFARAQNAKHIKRQHVEEAISEKFYRLNLIEEHLLEAVQSEDLLVSVDGERVGQINGLVVYDMGDYAFGKIGRITCTTSVSHDGLFNVDRASKLSGPIHDKGMYILSGFINSILARARSLSYSASVCFEQSYGMVDGDSASLAEFIAIISAMAQIPIQQNMAITGSMNQLGDAQPIGGINEKIEGFHKTCQLIGRKKSYGIVMPYQNVPNLMLSKEVQESVRSGYLRIYPVRYVWEAFELLTGHVLGIKSLEDKKFQTASVLDQIEKKLEAINKEAHKDDDKEKDR